VQFIHCADIHLDSPLIGLEAYEGAPVSEIRGATRRAFENIVQLAIDKQAAFLLISGDLYDGDQQDYNTALFLARQMSRLKDAGIYVYIIHGNHDAASKLTKTLKLPNNVFVFRSRSPETKMVPNLEVAIHGQGFSRADVREDLAANYPSRRGDAFNIGLLHTCLSGTVGHEPYAPTSLDILKSKGYHYWALGHIHGRSIQSEDPWIVYPGNPQGRHIRETGEKSCELVTVDAGGIVTAEPVPVAQVLWQRAVIDASSSASANDVLSRAEDRFRDIAAGEHRLCCVRIEIVGLTNSDAELRKHFDKLQAELRASALDIARDQIWVERVKLNTSLPIDKATLVDRDDPGGETLRILELAQQDASLRDELAKSLSDLRSKLPADLTEGQDPLLLDGDHLVPFLKKVEQELLARLSDRGAA
jgi:exonuclease SbcD